MAKLSKGKGEASPSAAREKQMKSAPAETKKVVGAPEGARKISDRLLETIEKRKQMQAKAGGLFARPVRRRGRRPKNAVEYTPSNQEEDGYSMDPEVENIEYDTGIRVKNGRDDGGQNLDRFEDYDEELNFDR